MLVRFVSVWVAVLSGLSILGAAAPIRCVQDKSVRPGINDPFRDPDVKEWVTRFEGESRETFDKRKEIVKACGLKTGMAVADVGAGTGLFTRLFAQEVGRDGTVYAVEISQKFLDHIDQSAKGMGVTNVRTVLGKDLSVELPANSVDLAFICDTYHHFEYPHRMMTSIHKALKPGGRVVIVDFIRIAGKSSDWVMNHVRAGQDIVEREIAECGFKKSGVKDGILKDNYIVIFEKKEHGSSASGK